MTILETKDLRKVYGSGDTEVRALDGVDLTVEKGEFVAVVGTSGSGKSTLLHMLGGLDRPTSGSVTVDGKNIFSLKDEALTIFRRRKIGFVFQSFNLVPVLTVRENIVLPIQLDGGKVDERYVGEVVTALGLEKKLNSLPGQLSGGQQQRVAIARALIKKPDVLLLDEPLSNLDARLRMEMRAEIRRIQQESKVTTIFVTHDQDEAMVMSDVIHLMYNGKIEQSATPTEMYTEPVSKFAATFIGHYNMVPVDAFKKMTGVDGEGTDVAFRPEVIDISTKPVEREGCVTIKGHVVVSLPHGNVLRYAVMCGDHQIDVDVLFKKATIIPNGTDVYLTLKHFPL